MLDGKGISFSYKHKEVLNNVSFTINDGETVGLVGPNGVGKSTLLKIAAGQLSPVTGSVVKPKGYEVGYMPQDLEHWVDTQVYDFLEEVSGMQQIKKEYDQVTEQIQENDEAKPLTIFQEVYDKAEKHEMFHFEENAEKALTKVGLEPVTIDRYIKELSGGQRTRLALAAVMVSKHDLFLLDEPTNNLDIPGIVLLEKFIQGSKASFMVVSHDRRFLRQTADRILELTGQEGINSYGLGYDEYIEEKHRQEEAARQRYEEHKEEEQRLQESAKKALGRSGVAATARNRSDNEKIGFNAAKERAVKGHSKTGKRIEKRLEQMEEPPLPPEEIFLDFSFESAEIINKNALSVKDIVIEYPATETAPEFRFGPFSLDVHIGERTAITGNNGVGKTSLLKAITNPDIIESGAVDRANFANIGYMDQHHSLPERGKTALENLKLLTGVTDESDARRLFKKFNIGDETVFTKGADISPGERSKVLLASIAYNRSNVLLLDEPTNHLDIPSIEGLERALSHYQGAILLVTHDRDFLEALKIKKNIEIG